MATILGLFSGAGGLDEGFIQAGFEAIAHVEMNPKVCDTLRTRAAYHYLQSEGKISTYKAYLRGAINRDALWASVPKSELNKVLNYTISAKTVGKIIAKAEKGLGDRSLDIIVGGPPCQSFSRLNKNRINALADERSFLFKHYVSILRGLKPKMFLFENVSSLTTAEGGKILRSIRAAFTSAGYCVQYKILNAKDYGVCQSRERVFIVGVRNDLEAQFSWPKRKKLRFNILDLVRDLPAIEAGGKRKRVQYIEPNNDRLRGLNIRADEDTMVTQHYAWAISNNYAAIFKRVVRAYVNDRKVLLYSELPEHLRRFKVHSKFEFRFKCYKLDQAPQTIVAESSTVRRYPMPILDQVRPASFRELARIQSFPDNYFFEGGTNVISLQIGNAVPVHLAKVLAERCAIVVK